MIDQIARMFNDTARTLTNMMQPHVDIVNGGCPGCAQATTQRVQAQTRPPQIQPQRTTNQNIVNVRPQATSPCATGVNNVSAQQPVQFNTDAGRAQRISPEAGKIPVNQNQYGIKFNA